MRRYVSNKYPQASAPVDLNYIFIVKMELVSQAWNARTPYLTEEAGSNLTKFKYAGSDASILYNRVWSPLAEYTTKFFPRWVAYDFLVSDHIP